MGKGEHPCPFCERVFTRAQHVVRHARVHTGERPYPCDLCEDKFQRQDMLTRHRTKHHPDAPNPDGSAAHSPPKPSPTKPVSKKRARQEEPQGQEQPSAARSTKSRRASVGVAEPSRSTFHRPSTSPFDLSTSNPAHHILSYLGQQAASGSQAIDTSSFDSAAASGLPFPFHNAAADASYSYDQSGMEQFDFDLAADIETSAEDYNAQAQSVYNASNPLAIVPQGLGELALEGLAGDLGGDLDWNDMMESWAGVVDDEWKQGSVSAAWLAHEVERNGGVAAGPSQEVIPSLPDISGLHPSVPVLSYSSGSGPTSASSSNTGSFPPFTSPRCSGSASSSSTNDHANSNNPFALYSSSLRSFATAILSSLPKIAAPKPSSSASKPFALLALRPAASVATKPTPAVPAAAAVVVPLTIIERRAAMKAKLAAEEDKKAAGEWFTLGGPTSSST